MAVEAESPGKESRQRRSRVIGAGLSFPVIRLRHLAPIWRVLLATVAFQLLGGVTGVLVGLHHSVFENSSLGAGIATPIGFVVGLLWQLSRVERRKTTPRVLTIFIGLLAAWLGATTAFFDVPRARDEMRRLDHLRRLATSGINQILVFDRYGKEKLQTVRGEAALLSFVEACRDVAGNSPNHPTYTHSWYLVVVGQQALELECHYEAGRSEEVVGCFVRKSGNTTFYYGSFAGRRLRGWFEKFIAIDGR